MIQLHRKWWLSRLFNQSLRYYPHMRYRKGNSKIKYEHGMISGLRDLLERIEPWPEIVSVIPGEIRPARGSDSGIHLLVKYPTQSGIKVIAKSTTAVQEVFFVTREPDLLIKRINALSAKPASGG